MTTSQKIERSREARLWIGQIIVPAITLATGIIVSNPEYRAKATEMINNVGNSIKKKFKRKEDKPLWTWIKCTRCGEITYGMTPEEIEFWATSTNGYTCEHCRKAKKEA